MPDDPLNSLSTLAQMQVLQAWFSPQFPTGGFAFSHGLEALVADGSVSDEHSFSTWLENVMLHGSGRNDALLLGAAYREHGDCSYVNDFALAVCSGQARLLETTAQGSAFAKTIQSAFGVALDVPATTMASLALPVAAGVAARRAGLDLTTTTLAYLQAMAANLIFAGVRAVPLGQTQGQRLLADLLPRLRALVDQVQAQGLADIGTDLWLADSAALAQETLGTRIFRS